MKLLEKHFFYMSTINEVEKHICVDFKIVYYLQFRQFRRAREELQLYKDFDIDATFSTEEKRSINQFYTRNFGFISVETPNRHSSIKSESKTTKLSKEKRNNKPNPRNNKQQQKQEAYPRKTNPVVNKQRIIKTIVYYRLWKNANDYIRTMLYRFAHFYGEKINVDKKCQADDCIDGDVNFVNAYRANAHYISSRETLNRYPFTFVRNPISRFISAFNEIETRHHTKNKSSSSPFIGTAERFQSFMLELLSSEGIMNKALFMRRPDMFHAVPQIGTLVLASTKEKAAFNAFRIEHFDNEWTRLANESSFSRLQEVNDMERTAPEGMQTFKPHLSSSDPFMSAFTAWEFLAHANDSYLATFTGQPFSCASPASSFHADASDENLFCFKSSPAFMPRPAHASQAKARAFLRAICRIYLTDFLCAHYALPAECSDLTHEYKSDLKEYTDKINEGSSPSASFTALFMRAFRLLPVVVKHPLAELACTALAVSSTYTAFRPSTMSLSLPECIAGFMHDLSLLSFENHEEDEYDEL